MSKDIVNKTKLLFVCLGNICRSPAAEEIMRQVIIKNDSESDFFVDSCGIGGWHTGQLPDSRMRQAGKQMGYDFTNLARQFTDKDFEEYDYIFCMDKENISALQSKTDKKVYLNKIILLSDYLTKYPEQEEIPDPYYSNWEDFFVADLLQDACRTLFDRFFKN